jgi:hypothetical protein
LDPHGLLCPLCARVYADSERFCAECSVPLVYPDALQDAPAQPVSRRRRQARKIKPQYTDGKLVRVALALNQPEGELIQGMLLEAGVPSLLRRASAADVPEFMAGGRWDVLVSESGAQTAREALQPDRRQES